MVEGRAARTGTQLAWGHMQGDPVEHGDAAAQRMTSTITQPSDGPVPTSPQGSHSPAPCEHIQGKKQGKKDPVIPARIPIAGMLLAAWGRVQHGTPYPISSGMKASATVAAGPGRDLRFQVNR